MGRQVVPLANLQRRTPEAGRIRTGIRVPAGKGTRPKAIETFRFTSSDRTAIEQVAAIYGGTPAPWTDAPTPGQWEVITTSSEIRVVLPPDPLGATPLYEMWGAGGCVRRCDGLTAQVTATGPEGPELTDVPCICAADEAMACKPHTRLSVILPDIRFAGTWRYESATSWAVAQEMPGMVDLIQSLQSRGLTRALLGIEHRKSTSAGQTRRFTIPVLRVAESMDALAEGAARVGAIGAAGVSDAPAIEAGPSVVADLDDEPVVAHVEPGADELVDRERVIALSRLADKAWPLDDFGRGETAHRDRMRHALTLRITDGRTHHLNEISLVEADRIEKGLVMIVCGDVSWEATGEALVITSPDGMRAEYPWVETAGAN